MVSSPNACASSDAIEFRTLLERWRQTLGMTIVLTGAEFRVAILMLEKSNRTIFDQSGFLVSWQGHPALARCSGLSEPGVRAARTKLCARGVIGRTEKGGHGPRDTSKFIFKADWLEQRLEELSRSGVQDVWDGKVISQDHHPSERRSPKITLDADEEVVRRSPRSVKVIEAAQKGDRAGSPTPVITPVTTLETGAHEIVMREAAAAPNTTIKHLTVINGGGLQDEGKKAVRAQTESNATINPGQFAFPRQLCRGNKFTKPLAAAYLTPAEKAEIETGELGRAEAIFDVSLARAFADARPVPNDGVRHRNWAMLVDRACGSMRVELRIAADLLKMPTESEFDQLCRAPVLDASKMRAVLGPYLAQASPKDSAPLDSAISVEEAPIAPPAPVVDPPIAEAPVAPTSPVAPPFVEVDPWANHEIPEFLDRRKKKPAPTETVALS